MSSLPPDARRSLEETLESIADRTPVAAGELAGHASLAVIAAVAEGFRIARFGESTDPEAERWGALELREELGRGSFGEVRLAWDPALHRVVALKLRHAESGVLRWLDEARALARVRHPNVVVVHGADLRDGRAGIWMERVPGGTLEHRLSREGPLAAAEVARIGVQLASALRAVHAAGLLHGDIKTGNVMWDESDPQEPRAVLMDFGAVRETSGDDLLGSLAAAGTPLALAPEQFDGASPSVATDVYALGVLLFRLLTGRWPVEGRTLDELRATHRAGRAASVSAARRDVPAALARAVERAIAPDPRRRTHDASHLLRELRAIAEPARVWRGRLALATTAVAIAGAAVVLVPRLLASRQPAAFRARALPAPTERDWGRHEWSAWGTTAGAELAWHAVGLGDLDGDGRDEVAVSEVHWNDGGKTPGRVNVYFGSPAGLEREPRWVATGTHDGEALGTYLAAAGDVNGDGRPDLLASAVGARGPHGERGAASLWLGDGRSLARGPAWIARGPASDVGFGFVIAGGFDVNGDGFTDALVSAVGESLAVAEAGVVRLYLGSRTGLSVEPAWKVGGDQPGATFGLALAAGDANGDGFDDVLVSANLWSGERAHGGRVQLWAGGPSGPGSAPAWTYDGDTEGARAGVSLAMGDVDGDGCDDAVVSESYYSTADMVECGRVLWFRGGPRGLSSKPAWSWTGPATHARVGTNRVLVRDLDGDGRAEVIVGAYNHRRTAAAGATGLVAVFRGSPSGPAAQPTWWVAGAREGESFGIALGAAGDTRGDGRRGLLVGSPYASGPEGTLGRADLYTFAPASRRNAAQR